MFIEKCVRLLRISSSKKASILDKETKTGFKGLYYVRGQGVPCIESGAYTQVREHFNARDNTAIGHKMGL
jgi:hypothetical protein